METERTNSVAFDYSQNWQDEQNQNTKSSQDGMISTGGAVSINNSIKGIQHEEELEEAMD